MANTTKKKTFAEYKKYTSSQSIVKIYEDKI